LLVATRAGWPGPIPGLVNLSGAELDGWVIEGAGPDAPPGLRGARFDGASLAGARFRHVELSSASFHAARLAHAEFVDVSAAELDLSSATLTASTWLRCRLPRLRADAAGTRAHAAAFVDCQLDPADLAPSFPEVGAVTRCRPVGSTQPQTLPSRSPADLASYDHTLKLWDAASGTCLRTHVHGPGGETATLGGMPARVVSASPGAWRFLALRYVDPRSGAIRLLPHDHLDAAPRIAE
jgi:hypothetical protein